jgi:hypothetical protein
MGLPMVVVLAQRSLQPASHTVHTAHTAHVRSASKFLRWMVGETVALGRPGHFVRATPRSDLLWRLRLTKFTPVPTEWHSMALGGTFCGGPLPDLCDQYGLRKVDFTKSATQRQRTTAERAGNAVQNEFATWGLGSCPALRRSRKRVLSHRLHADHHRLHRHHHRSHENVIDRGIRACAI